MCVYFFISYWEIGVDLESDSCGPMICVLYEWAFGQVRCRAIQNGWWLNNLAIRFMQHGRREEVNRVWLMQLLRIVIVFLQTLHRRHFWRKIRESWLTLAEDHLADNFSPRLSDYLSHNIRHLSAAITCRHCELFQRLSDRQILSTRSPIAGKFVMSDSGSLCR